MIDHTGLDVSDPARSRRFYEQALGPLGYKVLMEVPQAVTGGVVVRRQREPLRARTHHVRAST